MKYKGVCVIAKRETKPKWTQRTFVTTSPFGLARVSIFLPIQRGKSARLCYFVLFLWSKYITSNNISKDKHTYLNSFFFFQRTNYAHKFELVNHIPGKPFDVALDPRSVVIST